MWGRGNPRALLVGMQTGTATVENSMESPHKSKNGTALWPATPLLGIYPKSPKTSIWKNIGTPMFMAIFTIAKIWQQPKYPWVDEWIKQLWLFLIEQDHERSPRVCLLEASKRELQESSGTWSWTQESGFAYEYALWFRGSPIVFFLHFQLNCHYKHLSPLGHHNHPCMYKWN